LSIQKNIASLYSAQLISVGAGFLNTLLLARMLGPALQGEWAVYLQFTQFSTLLLSVGLPGALVYFIASGKLCLRDAQGLIWKVLIGAGIVLGVFSFLYARSGNTWFLPENLLRGWPLVLIPLHSLILLAVQCQSALLQAQNKFKKTARIQVGGALCLLLVTALLYWVFPSLSWPKLPILLVFYTFISFGQWVLLREPLPAEKNGVSSLNGFSLLWQYSGLAFATNVIQFLNYKIDVWFLRYYECHPIDLGVYTLSVSLTQLLWLFPQALQSILFRDISNRKDIENLYRETRRWTLLLVLYVFVAGLLGTVLARYLVPILFGEAYAEVSKMIVLLLSGIAPFGVIMIVSAYFSGTGRVWINFVSAIIGFFVGVMFDWLWIQEYGIWGAAAASIASYWATALFVLLMFFFEKKATRSAISVE
jgi:O-antigen/teichoic acid export membrane protein